MPQPELVALALAHFRKAQREVHARDAPAPEAIEDRAQRRADRADPPEGQEMHEPEDEDARPGAELSQELHRDDITRGESCGPRDHEPEDRGYGDEGGPAEEEPAAREAMELGSEGRPLERGFPRKSAKADLDEHDRYPARAGDDVQRERSDDPRGAERISHRERESGERLQHDGGKREDEVGKYRGARGGRDRGDV